MTTSRRSRPRHMAVITALLTIFVLPALAVAQTASLHTDRNDLYATIPFTLSISIQGFDEEPAPIQPPLAIEGCRVTPQGVTPNVARSTLIFNGRRQESTKVTWVLSYRVVAPKAGQFNLPAMTVQQGSHTASTSAARITVRDISASEDMKIRLVLPERPVWVGETFEAGIELYLRREVSEQTFSVPLFDLPSVQVAAPAHDGRKTLSFPAGNLNLDLPYTNDRATLDGQSYTRFRFSALVTANRAGSIDLEPTQIAANLESGSSRDMFGFSRKRFQLFKAEDQPRRLSVRPLPQQGRPDSFANAIGTSFSIQVRANRTVVQAGDPLDLAVHVRGDGHLDGLTLPRLNTADGLPSALFSVPDENVVGEMDPENNGKIFRVTVRLKSAEATEIPALPFSYFDPVAGAYRTIRSEPIALSVKGSTMVGAADIVAATTSDPTTPTTESAPTIGASSPTGFTTLSGADLSLSADADTMTIARSASDVRLMVGALYILPLVVFGVRAWRVRTGGRRGRESELRDALRAVEKALDQGQRIPARDAAPTIVSAVRSLAKTIGRSTLARAAEIEQLETLAFDPAAAQEPLPAAMLEAVRRVVRSASATAGPTSSGRDLTVAVLLPLIALSAVLVEPASATTASDLEAARELYRQALVEKERVRRTRLFGDAEQALRALALESRSPELLTDWGNAALGAQERGWATLAYRRALYLAPQNERARANLHWLRDRAPAWLPRPRANGALDSLFFWHHSLSRAQRSLAGACAFALAVLLLAPWSVRAGRALRRVAVVAFVVWIAMTVSALVEPDPSEDAVLIDDQITLRSADSLGAPPSLSSPLPAGTELRVLETRDGWSRVALTDDTRGWLSTRAIRPVLAP